MSISLNTDPSKNISVYIEKAKNNLTNLVCSTDESLSVVARFFKEAIGILEKRSWQGVRLQSSYDKLYPLAFNLIMNTARFEPNIKQALKSDYEEFQKTTMEEYFAAFPDDPFTIKNRYRNTIDLLADALIHTHEGSEQYEKWKSQVMNKETAVVDALPGLAIETLLGDLSRPLPEGLESHIEELAKTDKERAITRLAEMFESFQNQNPDIYLKILNAAFEKAKDHFKR